MGLANILSFTLGTVVGSQAVLRASHLRNPHPLPHQLGALLDHQLRARYRNPVETLGLFGVAPGMTVLDVGCGTGLYTTEMARMVGPNGKVHAVDVQPAMIARTRERLAAVNEANSDSDVVLVGNRQPAARASDALVDRTELHLAAADNLPLPDASIDLAVAIASVPQMARRTLALLDIQRVLKPGGRLAVSEELLDPAYVPEFVLRRWLEDVGFRYGGRSGNPFCYNLIFFND